MVVVGGGLAGSLLAYRLVAQRPDVDLVVLEAGVTLGGDHTWSFHEADLRPASYQGAVLDPGFVRPLASASWAGHEVRFPEGARQLRGGYHAIRSRDLRVKLAPLLGSRLRLGARVATLSPGGVTLEGGETLSAACVVDARGSAAFGAACAWQTFFGVFLRTAADHGLARPLLMDATVPQRGGFRFLYVLPFGPRELLVEDTRYAASAAVDEAGAREFLPGYLRRLGIEGYEETGSEAGALPIPLLAAARPAAVPGTVAVGVGAGLFQPTTGYSVRAAALAAALFTQRASAYGLGGLAGVFDDYAAARWRDGAFYRRLNNMLFMAAAPSERWRVMAKFYRLDERVVSRFYRQELTAIDRLKILSGRPPVPIGRGLRAYFARSARA